MTSKTLSLTEKIYTYFQAKSLREPAILRELREETAKLSNAQMQISPEQGQLMGLLIELINARKTLEVGVFTGYSALAVALALPEDGKIVACDLNEEWTAIAKKFWQSANVAHKIDLRIAPALETLDGLIANGEQASFDFAFIDADKQNYLNYYERCLTLLRRGGLLAIDNVLWYGDVADTSIQNPSTVAIRTVNDFVHQDERVTMSMLPIGDGVTLARKR